VPGTACVLQLKEAESELVLENVPRRPAFASMNRDYSFYGTFRQADATSETLALQTRLDPNPYNRVDAMRQLTDQQRVRLLLHHDGLIDAEWLELYGNIIGDRGLPSALKAYFLRIDEQPMDRGYSVWYPELVVARERLMRAVNERYRDQLLENFRELDTYARGGSPKDGIEDRLLKQVLLDLIVVDDSPESHQLILEHLAAATTATDRVAALLALNRSSSPRRHAVLEDVYGTWHKHLSGYANYLRVISSGTQDDVFDMIAREKERPSFDITQPTWCRALFLPMAVNTRKLWTDEGIRWIGDTVIALAPINATTTSRLLNTFQHVRKLKPELREKVIPTLERIVERVSPEVSPTIHGQASAYLRS